MKVTKRIHAMKIPFKVSVSPEVSVDRFVFAYMIFGEKIHLIDSGVAGADSRIWKYIKEQGREPNEVSNLILTHSHPDHIGSAKTIKKLTGCTIFAHKDERNWIEDTEKQFRERPVPGFQTLVEGSVGVDHPVVGGEIIELEKNIVCKVIHTPGHSKGSISLLFEGDKSLFTADSLVYPGDLPIYEDIFTCLSSINVLQKIKNVENMFSSWEYPIQGRNKIGKRMEESITYLQRIHNAVISSSNDELRQDMMGLCKEVVGRLGLPLTAVNPLVAKAFASSLADKPNQEILKT